MEKKPNPLNVNEWLQFLLYDRNQNYMIYYSETQYLFTRYLLLFAAITGMLAINSIIVNLLDEKNLLFFISIFGSLILLLFVVSMIAYYGYKISNKIRPFRDKIIGDIDKIIVDILNGNLTDVDEIRERYASSKRTKLK